LHALDGLLLSQRPRNIDEGDEAAGSPCPAQGLQAVPARQAEVAKDHVVGSGRPSFDELPPGPGHLRGDLEARRGQRVQGQLGVARVVFEQQEAKRRPWGRGGSHAAPGPAGGSALSRKRARSVESTAAAKSALHRKPSAPAAAAAVRWAGSPSRLTIITRGGPARSFNRRVASMPFMPGIATSISTIRGR